MADLPKSQGPEWVLYEDMPEDGEIVSFDNAGDNEGAFEICQSEAGIVGALEESPYGAVCDTKDGAEEKKEGDKDVEMKDAKEGSAEAEEKSEKKAEDAPAAQAASMDVD